MSYNLLKEFYNTENIKDFIHQFNSSRKENIPLYTSRMQGSSLAVLAKLLFEKEDQVFIITDSLQEVNELKVELSLLGISDFVIEINELSREKIQEKLTIINSEDKFILISTPGFLIYPLPVKDEIQKNTTTIETGAELSYDDLIEYLHISNYSKDKFVESPGDFSVRGAIIDFWSYSESRPCRLEFDGDFLESIRYFDPDSQRSSSRVSKVTVASRVEDTSKTQSTIIFDYLDDPVVIATSTQLSELFSEENKVVSNNDITVDIDDELKEELFEGHDTGQDSGNEMFETLNHELSFDKLMNQQCKWIIQQEIGIDDPKFNFDFHLTPPVNSNFKVLAAILIKYSNEDYRVIITAENELQVKRLTSLLSDFNPEVATLIETKSVVIVDLPIKKGFVLKDEKLLVLTDYEIFNKPYRTKISSKQKYKKSKARDLASLKIGNYVVHETFGIGKYAGLETINIGLTQQESIKILYADGDVVYVNLNYLALVKKFSSNEEMTPRLTNLKNNEWKITKRKVKTKIKDAARQLIQLYAKRKSTTGYKFAPDTVWQRELEASFMYEDTLDQAKVTDELKVDMESENPMDRLVCGDVGFGKTEVAVRAAFKAVNDNKQVALLVPTTILAEQHYNTFKDRLGQFPVKVESLSRFSTKKQQDETVMRLNNGKSDIVIGTHRLLSKDIRFKDLGLLIVDEEHRFGVMHKEKLRSLRANVDTLTLTATPIPRTLNMSLLGARDLSIIATPPPNRIPIVTKVEMFDIIKIREWVMQEINRDGQIYFVHDRVQSIDKIAAYLQRHIPGIKIAIAHGQMRPSQLEKVVHDFLEKKYQMLIATKIIESGLDIPNVNTIIINRADRFGLAELHQLRGRVGRSDRQAFAYLLVPSLNTITKKAVRRLAAIEEYTDLGEGFNLSMRDLEIRGAGNLLGTEQSGAIDAVGFDLYVKMLDEAVEELKQSEFKEEFKDLPKSEDRSAPTIDTYFEIGIPKDYMPDQADRLSFYTAMFSIIKIEEMDEILEELHDRYGRAPEMVQQLVLAAKLRFYASIALLERIVVKEDKVIIILPKGDREEFYKTKFSILMEFIMKKYSRDIQFKQGKEVMKLEMRNKFDEPDDVLLYLIEFCKEVIEVVK